MSDVPIVDSNAQDLAGFIIRLHPTDSIAVAVQDIAPGRTFRSSDGGRLSRPTTSRPATRSRYATFAPGETVLRYGCRIGRASQPIAAGELGPQPQPGGRNAITGGYTSSGGCRHSSRSPAGGLPGLSAAGRAGGDAQLRGGDLVGALLGHVASRIARHFTPDRLAGFATSTA